MALSQKENISYESALEIVSKLANEANEAIKEIKDQKRTAKTNAKNRKKKLKKEQVNKNSWLSNYLRPGAKPVQGGAPSLGKKN